MIIAGRFDDDSIGGLQSISWELKENQIAAMLVSNSMKDEILLLKYQQLWLSWRILVCTWRHCGHVGETPTKESRNYKKLKFHSFVWYYVFPLSAFTQVKTEKRKRKYTCVHLFPLQAYLHEVAGINVLLMPL